MAPKAKQQAQAKSQPKAEAKAKAKAEPKAQAEPKAKAEPAAKAEAKAKAKADAKAKAKADPKAKQQAAPEPAAKGKAKAKGKAQPAPPPPEPEPVEDMQVVKKKKTNHRGGRNKNKEETDDNDQATIMRPSKTPNATAAKEAAEAAEQDPILQAFRQRTKIEGDAKARKIGLEALIKDIDQELQTRKAPHPNLRSSSTQLEQNLEELAEMKSKEYKDMMEEVRVELEAAKEQECFVALKNKFLELKAKCAENVKGINERVEKPEKKSLQVAAAADKPAARDNTEAREAAMLRRLASLNGKKDTAGLKTESKSLELSLDITKYLFTPPYNFSGRFEQQFKVLVEAKREAGKGGGKGGKGAAPPKDLTITGLGSSEVSDCEKALKALDFSGTQSKDIGSSLVVPGGAAKSAIEKEFDVFIFKEQGKLTVFGKNKGVSDAMARIEEEGYAKSISVSPELVRVIYQQKLLETWRSSGVTIALNQPPASDKGSSPAKITIAGGKGRADVEAAIAKVEDFANNHATEVVKANAEIVAKLFERANSSFLAKKFKEIQNSSNEVSLRKSPEGITLLGPKAKLKKVQADLKDLLQKASYEPVKVPLEADHEHIFRRETTDKIRESSGLMEMYRLKEEKCLVLLGDDAAVKKAQTEMEETIKNEGSMETVSLSDYACKELLVNKGAKIQEIQSKHGTSIQIVKNTLEAKIYGSAEGVEAAKKAIAAFAKKADNTTTKTLTLEQGQVGRVIGSRGATLSKIRSECGVQVNIGNDKPTVEIRGDAANVAKAEEMIKEVLSTEPKGKAEEEAPARAPAAANGKKEAAKPVKAKAAEFKADMTQDFPTLGGEAKAAPAARAWGKTAKADATPEEAKAEAYPEL